MWKRRCTGSRIFKGNYLKTGITGDPLGRYSGDFMRGKFMRIMTSGSRSDMMNLERYIVELDPGPLNFESWAGALDLDA